MDSEPTDEDLVDATEFEKIREERQREVDRLSLELLSNAKQYKKYIAKNHPEEHIKRADNVRRFLKYKPRVAGLFMELLEEYEDLGSTSLLVGTELQHIFKDCVEKAIQHLEWKEHAVADNACGADDEDILFGHAYKSKSSRRGAFRDDPFSFWGATITKSIDD
jgi:hypothetical protein